jgi:acetyl-CoA acetyltransferase
MKRPERLRRICFEVEVLVLLEPIDGDHVNGGAISVRHPYGMTGTRVAGHALLEGRHRNARLAVMTMCVGGGKGAASLFEID